MIRMENSMEKRLLLVEDNDEVRRQLRWGFSDEGYTVLQAGSVDEALALQRKEKPQVITLDLGLPPDAEGCSEGFRGLQELLAADPQARVVVVTGHHDIDNALRCINNGAYDFCRKPANLEELKIIVRRAFFHYGLLGEAKSAPKPAVQKKKHGIICQCKPMTDLLERVSKVASSDAPVLISGESGTGKELVAQAIHNLSGRADGPIVTINCGAIPEHLLESEFFGHEKGAFTGATQRVLGKVEYADKGSLFLDEIGELPLPMQVKLLRFLQEMVIQRVGGRQDISVNVRIIAATNRNLPACIKEGSFREDLYYRIGVVNLALPPLRAREEDIMLLARHFIQRHEQADGLAGKITGFTPEAEVAMRTYNWPGNVRELENKVRRAMIFAGSGQISLEDMELEECEESAAHSGARRGENLEGMTLRDARNNVEREMIVSAMERYAGNIAQAAQALGISRPTFYDLLKKHQIDI